MNTNPAQPQDPTAERTLLGALVTLDTHGAFLRAVARAGLEDDLDAGGPFTLLAPSDEAFERFGPSIIEDLASAEGGEPLIDLVEYQLLRGRIDPDALVSGAGVATVQGEAIVIPREAVGATIPCRNGLLVIVDRVLLPPGSEAEQLCEFDRPSRVRVKAPFLIAREPRAGMLRRAL
jgi:uncharacterized surface protein with fasciclin (FAS1) repeats